MEMNKNDLELECVLVAGLKDVLDVMKISELPKDNKGLDLFIEFLKSTIHYTMTGPCDRDENGRLYRTDLKEGVRSYNLKRSKESTNTLLEEVIYFGMYLFKIEMHTFGIKYNSSICDISGMYDHINELLKIYAKIPKLISDMTKYKHTPTMHYITDTIIPGFTPAMHIDVFGIFIQRIKYNITIINALVSHWILILQYGGSVSIDEPSIHGMASKIRKLQEDITKAEYYYAVDRTAYSKLHSMILGKVDNRVMTDMVKSNLDGAKGDVKDADSSRD